MSRRPHTPDLFENPLLIGSVILAVSVVGVVLSYNASRGLPFVPKYQIQADVRDAAELVAGNSEVRVRGNRVGIVKAIEPIRGRGAAPWFSRLTLSLDPGVANLPVDTHVKVRPRSILGSKYLDVEPGRSTRTVPPGGVLPITQDRAIVEFDEAFNVFDRRTSDALRRSVVATGDALAGRGPALNETFVAFRQLIGPLQRVLALLSDPSTNLAGFISGAAQVSGALLPVAATFADLFDHGATTFAALDAVRDRLGESLEELPPTESVTTHAVRKINPVLDDAAAIARDIRPGSELLQPATLGLADTVEQAAPVVRRTPRLWEPLEDALTQLEQFVDDDETNPTARALNETVDVLRPTIHVLVPAQLQCNIYGIYSQNVAGVAAEGDAWGTWLNALSILNTGQQFQSAEPAPDLHLNMLPHEDYTECEAGNEPFKSGQRIGNPPGKQSDHTEETPRQ